MKLLNLFSKQLFILALLLLSFTTNILAQDSIRTIKIGCDYAYYPYEFINENHEADGFDIDIIKAIGREININLEINAGNWFKIKNELEKGEIDVIAGMYYLPDRAEKVNFSMPYIIITHSIFVKDGDYWQSLKDVRDEENLKVVVENSSILHKYLTTAGIASNRILPVENQLDALKILSETPNSVALLPDLQGKYIANKNGFDNIVTVGLPILPREYSIAVNKQDTILLNKINDAITTINNNGSYDRIYTKWFGNYKEQSSSIINLSILEIILILLLILIIIYFFYWNNKMKNRMLKNISNLNQAYYDKQKAQNELNKKETILRKITENTPYPIAMLNKKGSFSYVNRLFEDEFGYTRKEVRNFKQWITLFFDEKHQKVAQKKIEDIFTKLESNYELKAISTEILSIQNKEKNEIKVIMQIVSLGEGQMLFFFENVTEVLSNEQKLKDACLKAESADKLKSSFLANISHEIRTPMNAILGFSSLLAEEDIEKDDKHLYTKLIRKNGNVLLLLIQDIIDFSKIEAGELSIYPKIINLTDSITDAFAVIKEDHNLKIPDPIKFILKLPKNIEHAKYFVRVDANRLSQVLINLLTNSFKYTDKGSVEFGFFELENNKIRVYVKDTGIGIREEEQKHIFKRFSRVESKTALMRGGTGLGLAIAYQILKLFGSELFVQSEQDKGSTFYFDLNFYEGQGEKVDKKPQEIYKTALDYDWSGKTILIVEDNKENANFLIAAIKKTNSDIIFIKDGKEAIITLQNNENINLVILDWVLPEVGGDEITKFIKQKKRKLPVIVVTALAMLDEKVDIMSHNVDAYFSKPVEKAALLHKINSLLFAQNES